MPDSLNNPDCARLRSNSSANRLEKGKTYSLDEMPTIGDLGKPRGAPGCGFAIARAAFSSDKFDTQMFPKTGDGGVTLAIRKECCDMAALKIADDGSVSTPSSRCPIISVRRAQRPNWTSRAATNDSQERIFANREGKPVGKTMFLPPAKSGTESMGDGLHSAVRGPNGSAIVASSCSANFFRGQIDRTHRKRRTVSLIRPCAGKLARDRW